MNPVPEEEELQALRSKSNRVEVNYESCKTDNGVSCGVTCVKRQLRQRISILNWITSYNREDVISDFIAGVTLGLTIIPQSIAYAALAGLPSQYGLYAAYMGEWD